MLAGFLLTIGLKKHVLQIRSTKQTESALTQAQQGISAKKKRLDVIKVKLGMQCTD